MSEDDFIAIYVAHVQSADKIDESRNSSGRIYGSLCAILTVAVVGVLSEFSNPVAAIFISLLLVLVSIGWFYIIRSLTSKLTAKGDTLREMEKQNMVPMAFLLRERELWETMEKLPLQKALSLTPQFFIGVGLVLFSVSVFRVTCGLL